MKILNGGTGSSGSSSGVEPGDIVLSALNKSYDETEPDFQSKKWFDLTYSNYIAEYEDTDILQYSLNGSLSGPQLVAFKKASTLSVQNNAQITKIANDKYLFTSYNGLENKFYNVGTVIKGISLQVVNIEIENANYYSSVYDYNNTVYVYKNSNLSGDASFINKVYKINLTTLEYEEITINNKRICKAYFDKTQNKFITHEFNNIDDADQDTTKSGIFVSDDFENTSQVATFEALSNNDDFKNKTILTSIKNVSDKMLYTTDHNFLIYHDTEKQLKKYVNGIASVAIDVLDKNQEKTLVLGQSILLEYDGNYFLCYSHKVDETTKYKTWVRRKNDLTEVSEYCFCEDFTSFDFNNGYILKNVYKNDYINPELPQFGYAIAYQDTDMTNRKVVTFRNSYIYENVNTINDGSNYWFIKNYFIDINYTEIFNGGDIFVIDNFGTMITSSPWEGNISSIKFDGFGVPGVYVKSMEGTETSKYFLRVKK